MEKTLYPLHDRIFACLAGSAIGDAMGGPVEGLTPAEISERHGIVDRLLPYPASRPPSFHGPFSTEAVDYSDDTRLAKLICAGLITSGGIMAIAPVPAPAAAVPTPTGLLDAVRSGNEPEVLRLLRDGANLDERGEHGRTALHFACAAGHVSIVRDLLLFGDDINRKDFNKTTALHFAAWENHIDIVDLLLDWGIFPEETEGSGWTALHDSVRKEFHDIPLRILAKARGLVCEDSLARELKLLHGEDRFLRLLEIMSEYHIALGSIGICGHGLLYDAKKRGYSRAAKYLREKGVTHEE